MNYGIKKYNIQHEMTMMSVLFTISAIYLHFLFDFTIKFFSSIGSKTAVLVRLEDFEAVCGVSYVVMAFLITWNFCFKFS